MKSRRTLPIRNFLLASLVALTLPTPRQAAAEPSPAAVAAFNTYCAQVETRLTQQHRSPQAFLARPAANSQNWDQRLRQGEFLVEKLAPAASPAASHDLDGALLHHWRGTAFAPGAKAADFERLMRDFPAYPRYFAPEVTQARVLTTGGDRIQASMRVRQKHILTVVMDTDYDIVFSHLDAQRGGSISHSTRIAEIASPGSAAEHALSPGEEHGFLWRLNTYWSYEERDGGLYLQIESISLTRSIPAGLGWAIGPFVESIPRESLEFTLRSTCQSLRQ